MLDPKAVSVIFDFVEPFWARWNLGPGYGDAELKRFKHPTKISIRRSFANLLPRIRVHSWLTIPRGPSGMVRAPDGCCPDSSRLGLFAPGDSLGLEQKEFIYGYGEHREISENQGSGFGQI